MSTTVDDSYWLTWYQRLSYSVGHVLNDLCASIWFSYLLVFYHHVLNFSNENAGLLLLLGQVSDAIATPLVGYESDRINGFFNYTKRKSWHLLGTICVAATFPFLFMQCMGCYISPDEMAHTPDWVRFIYYAPFIVIFQFGWAATQISHLSLIPELTPNASERVELNAIRYAFTVCSSIAVYLLAWLLLQEGEESSGASMGPSDAKTFRTLVLIVVGAGVVVSIFFHIFTKERRETDSLRGMVTDLSISERMNSLDWFKEPQFYMIAFLYMCTRLIVNVSQIYLPMFVTDSLKLSKQYIATVPLAVFVSGFLMSFIASLLNRHIGRKITFTIGIAFVLGAVTWMYFLHHSTGLQVFGAATFLGMGGSTLLVTSLSMTADLIGDRTESGAFVYGSMSFTDKLSNGIAVVIIQHLHPCKTEACCAACVWFYRDMIVFVPGGVAVAALIGIIIITPQTIGFLRKSVGQQALESERPGESETTAILGARNKTWCGDSGDMPCCSYLCCARLSSDAQDHKVVLCSTCGQEACCTHHTGKQGQTTYDSFSNCSQTPRPLSECANGGGGGTTAQPSCEEFLQPEVTTNDAELRVCAAGLPITVNADVHA